MAVDIVSEIITAFKAEIETITGFSQIDYEFDIFANSERSYNKRFGFIPLDATFAEGRAMNSTTMNHIFQLILCDDYQNKDDDSALGTVLNSLYAQANGLLVELQKKAIHLPTIGHQVLLVSGISFDLPEVLEDNNGVVALRCNFNIQYRFKNNC